MAKKQFVPLKIALLKKRLVKLRIDCAARMYMTDFVHVVDSALYMLAQLRRENKKLLKQIHNDKLPIIDFKTIPLSLSKEHNPSLVRILGLQQEVVERIKGESSYRIELLEDQVKELKDMLCSAREELQELENTKAEELSNKHIALIEKFNEVNKAAGIMMKQNKELKTDKMYKDDLLEKLKRWIRFAYKEIEPGEKTVSTGLQTDIKFGNKRIKLPELFIAIVDLRTSDDEFLQSMPVGVQHAIIDMAYSLKEKFPGKIQISHYNHIPSSALTWLTEEHWWDVVKDAGTMKYISRLYDYFGIKYRTNIAKVPINSRPADWDIHEPSFAAPESLVKDELSLLLKHQPEALSTRAANVIRTAAHNGYGQFHKDLTVSDLTMLTRKDWLKYRNVGKGTVKEITGFYRYLGIDYRQEAIEA